MNRLQYSQRLMSNSSSRFCVVRVMLDLMRYRSFAELARHWHGHQQLLAISIHRIERPLKAPERGFTCSYCPSIHTIGHTNLKRNWFRGERVSHQYDARICNRSQAHNSTCSVLYWKLTTRMLQKKQYRIWDCLVPIAETF